MKGKKKKLRIKHKNNHLSDSSNWKVEWYKLCEWHDLANVLFKNAATTLAWTSIIRDETLISFWLFCSKHSCTENQVLALRGFLSVLLSFRYTLNPKDAFLCLLSKVRFWDLSGKFCPSLKSGAEECCIYKTCSLCHLSYFCQITSEERLHSHVQYKL